MTKVEPADLCVTRQCESLVALGADLDRSHSALQRIDPRGARASHTPKPVARACWNTTDIEYTPASEEQSLQPEGVENHGHRALHHRGALRTSMAPVSTTVPARTEEPVDFSREALPGTLANSALRVTARSHLAHPSGS